MAHPILTPGFVRRDERGLFEEIVNGVAFAAVSRGRMRAGAVMGNHYHRRTRIFFYLVSGSAEIRTRHAQTQELDSFLLAENQGVFLEVLESHAIRFREASEFLMLKSEKYDPADPDTFPLPVFWPGA